MSSLTGWSLAGLIVFFVELQDGADLLEGEDIKVRTAFMFTSFGSLLRSISFIERK